LKLFSGVNSSLELGGTRNGCVPTMQAPGLFMLNAHECSNFFMGLGVNHWDFMGINEGLVDYFLSFSNDFQLPDFRF